MNGKMKNQNLELFECGEFKETKELPMDEISELMSQLAILQKRCGKGDMNSFLNMYHDGVTGQMLGFNKVNTNVHGMDCKADMPIYLEVKSVSWNGGPMNNRFAAFNDIGPDKAEAMKDKKVWLAVGVWFDINNLGFILWGQNKKIGEVLERKIKECKPGTRCSVTIPLSSLITKYGFKIIAVSISKQEVVDLLKTVNPKSYENLEKKVITLDEFQLENQSYYNRKAFLEYQANNGDIEDCEITYVA